MGGPSRAAEFRVARIAAAVALTGVVICIVLVDALRADYQVSEIVVGTLLAAIATLLGIEGLSWIRGGSPPPPPTWTDTGRQRYDVLRDDPAEDVTP